MEHNYDPEHEPHPTSPGSERVTTIALRVLLCIMAVGAVYFLVLLICGCGTNG